MKISQWLTLGLLACTSLAFEQRAEACSIGSAQYDSIPKNGEVYPANAALIFQGIGITLDRVKVTVDGVPAAFAAPPPMVKDVATIAASVTPEPMPGQTVVVQGSFCDPGVPPQGSCAPFTLTYTAGPRDESSLAGAHIASFDIHDHPGDVWDHGCNFGSDFTYWMHIASPDQPGTSPLLYTIEGYRGKGLSDLALKQSGFLTSEGKVPIRSSSEVLKGASLPEALCFRLTMADTAGHVSPWSELVCDPCYYRVESSPVSTSEPEWSKSDIYPGGSCDLGAPGGGKGGTTIRGCAQSAGGIGSPPAQLSLLAFCAALAVFTRRRRRS